MSFLKDLFSNLTFDLIYIGVIAVALTIAYIYSIVKE